VLFSTEPSVRDINTGWDYKINAISGRAGLQYFGNIAKNTVLTLGATYRFASNMSGDFTRYACTTSSSQIDTVSLVAVPNYDVEIPSELGFGFSVKKKDKWMFGFDYVRQDWTKSMFCETSGKDFVPSVSSSYKVGVEFIPNRYDIRYYMKRVTYRLGAYYDQTYIKINGNQVNAAGITFGMSLPIFRWYNAVTWSVDLGQRGSLDNGMVRERYAQFNLNFNLHDMWFIKKKYN
jgi:long-subunit fatty acid transport protein